MGPENSDMFPDDVDAAGWGLNFENQWFWGLEGRNEMWICNEVSFFAVRNSILFWLYILNSSLLCFLFSEQQNQSAGDKFHYSTFFEFSQGLLSIQLLVLALFCYFKDLLVFPRWFFP